MSVAGLVTVAVVYRYGQSRRGVPSSSLRDRTVCRGKDAGTFRYGEVDAIVLRQAFVKGMYPHSERSGQQGEVVVDDGLYRRYGVCRAVEGRCVPADTVERAGEVVQSLFEKCRVFQKMGTELLLLIESSRSILFQREEAYSSRT